MASKPFNSLPDETVDFIFRLARERPYPWNGTQYKGERGCNCHEQRFPVPATMLCLRTVSKRFHCIATSYVWEMVDIVIASDDEDPVVEQSEPEFRCRSTFGIIEFFISNPHYASLIKALRLSMWLVEDNWTTAGQRCVQATLQRFFRLTSSLSFLAVDGKDMLAKAAHDIFNTPSLRAFSDGGLSPAFSSLESLQDMDISHLEAIKLLKCEDDLPILLGLPLSLRSLSMMSGLYIAGSGKFELVREMFRSLVLPKVEEIAFIIDSSPVSRLISNTFDELCEEGVSVPLRELHGHFEMTMLAERLNVEQLVHAFRGADLRKLVLSSLDKIEIRLVAQITRTFPSLEFLSFSFIEGVDDKNETRREDIADFYARALGRAKHLATSEWQVGLGIEYDDSPRGWRNFKRPINEPIPEPDIDVLAVQCPSLRTVRILDSESPERMTHVYTIFRHADGAFLRQEKLTERGYVTSTISSWDARTRYSLSSVSVRIDAGCSTAFEEISLLTPKGAMLTHRCSFTVCLYAAVGRNNLQAGRSPF